MEDMEKKLDSILNDPKAMEQIMALAQSLGTSQPPPGKPEGAKKPVGAPPSKSCDGPPPKPCDAPPSRPNLGGFDPAMLRRMAGFAQQAGIDKNQQALLKALNPYLSREHIGRLERAMKAAKLASVASAAFGPGGAPF